jgi:hypothetical protein
VRHAGQHPSFQAGALDVRFIVQDDDGQFLHDHYHEDIAISGIIFFYLKIATETHATVLNSDDNIING